MLPDNLIFLSAQPYDFYFVWQVEVQICNFRKFGLSNRMHVLVWYPIGKETSLQNWIDLAARYPEVHFHFYKDKGVQLSLYIPQLRPHILARHFDKYPNLKDKILFYHDSDIIFNFLPDFSILSEGPMNWVSDTSSYLDYEYLRRKEIEGNIPEHEAISILCKIGNVSIEVFKSYTARTGGAQYILKNIDSDFWKDVERQVIEIRKAFFFNIPNSINAKYFTSENAGFQSWCADMWAINMSIWSRGRKTEITEQLDFSWATDTAETYLKKPIFHNAGATGTQPGVFYKAKWMNESPIGKNHSLNPQTASYYYGLAIDEAKDVTSIKSI